MTIPITGPSKNAAVRFTGGKILVLEELEVPVVAFACGKIISIQMSWPR